jgi:host factor-I protein
MKTPLSSSAPNGNAEEFVNRKLIRPTLPKAEVTRMTDGTGAATAPAREPEPKREKRVTPRSTFSGGEQTHAENFYYQKQMQSQTPMTVVLKNGETVQGVIEWYDKACIKLARNGRGSVLIYKTGIRYLHKTGE